MNSVQMMLKSALEQENELAIFTSLAMARRVLLGVDAEIDPDQGLELASQQLLKSMKDRFSCTAIIPLDNRGDFIIQILRVEGNLMVAQWKLSSNDSTIVEQWKEFWEGKVTLSDPVQKKSNSNAPLFLIGLLLGSITSISTYFILLFKSRSLYSEEVFASIYSIALGSAINIVIWMAVTFVTIWVISKYRYR